MSAGIMDHQSTCDHEMTSPPCEHNHWSDLRTRKNVKMLLCHVCLAKWRLCACRCSRNSCSSWAKRGTCSMGPNCPKLHIGHARPRAQRGSPPAAETPFTDAPYGLDVPAASLPPTPEIDYEPATPFTGGFPELACSSDYGSPSPALAPAMFMPSSASTVVVSDAPTPCPTPYPVSLRFVEPWIPPMCVSACGEYFEELDGYEPEGVAMTEEQLDALLRRRSLV